MIDTEFDLCFDEELLEVLTPEEIIYISLCAEEDRGGDPMIVDVSEFYESSAYFKLFDFYADEMPYGIAKCRTGEPDAWILNKLRERSTH
ncbi:hypothetical protein CMI47_15120 [Candidatus Pacearchaeota archaeon]|nr:hypothetical protein [Candidatus Pacearchaeota archaeon]|tara:strand:+ start:289 stop:558 length:270 start_codon:yes stop_codon:yes gene_type:complete